MNTQHDFHTPLWLGNEIVGATLCTNTGLQNITRPAGTKNPREHFDYLEIGTGKRKIRLYSTADAIFIKTSAVLARLKVQPRAAAVCSRFVVETAKEKKWDHDSRAPNSWLILDGLEFAQEEEGESGMFFRNPLLNDGELEHFVDDGAIVLNISRLILDVLKRLEDMREARLRDRGKTRKEMSPEQAARLVRKMSRAASK